jgi:hypothetical protein
MAKLSTQPDNVNFLSPLGFKFLVQKLPSTNFFTTQVNVPSVAVGDLTMPTPFIQVPTPGDQLQYGTLSLTFKVDEDLTNYVELYNWTTGIGFPESFDQYRDALNDNADIKIPTNLTSDGTLIVMNSNMRPNKEFTFKDLFPVQLGDLQFDAQQLDLEYITCTVDFRFTSFDIKSV